MLVATEDDCERLLKLLLLKLLLLLGVLVECVFVAVTIKGGAEVDAFVLILDVVVVRLCVGTGDV